MIHNFRNNEIHNIIYKQTIDITDPYKQTLIKSSSHLLYKITIVLQININLTHLKN